MTAPIVIAERLSYVDVVISTGQTKSAEFDTEGMPIVAVITPAGLTGTTLTFEAALTSGGTFYPVHSTTGSAYSVTVSTSRWTVIPPADLASIRYGKVVSSSSETGGDTITLVLAAVL